MYGDDYDFTQDAPKVVSREVSEYVVTHPGRSQYSQAGTGVSACGIATLNCARIVLRLHAGGLNIEQLVLKIMGRQLLEDILQPCSSWPSAAHLAVDEIHKAPIFAKSLKSVYSYFGPPTLKYFKKLISVSHELSQAHSTSTCVIITRPPEIIACFCITDTPGDLYIIFDSHPRPMKHPYGAAFIFKNNIADTADYLTNLLHYDERLLGDSTFQWQAQLLAQASGEIFIASDEMRSSADWANTALDASVQLLSLQARVRELESTNQDLEQQTRRLNGEVSEHEARRLELDDELERVKRKYEKLRKTPGTTGHGYHRVPTPTRPNYHLAHAQSPIGTTSVSRASVDRSLPFNDVGFIDPYAAQLQRDFDAENRQLERQHRELQLTQPKFFDCGICMESFQEDHVARVMPCDHWYCRPCLRGWVVLKVEEHRCPILCPTCAADRNRPTDPSEIEDRMIQQLGMTDQQYDIFSEMQLAKFSTIINCRKCQQTAFVDREEYQAADEIVCPLPGCGYRWCKRCSQSIENGGAKHSCDGSSELKHLMGLHGWKNCPGCQTPVDKKDGCNFMSCVSPGCNTHFCYFCGARILQSVLRSEIQSAKHQHYRSCTIH